MRQTFEKRYLLRGTFKGDGFEVKNCDCEVTINPLDTTSITAKIYTHPEDTNLEFMNMPIKSWNAVEFIDDTPGRSSTLRGRIKHQFIPQVFEVIAELDVFDFTKNTVFKDNDETADEIEMCFILTPCDFLQLGYDFKFDAKKGYLRGVHPWNDKYQDETLSIGFPWGKMEFYRNMYISASDPSIMILAEPPSISITYHSHSQPIEALWNEVEQKLNEILPLISYIDGQTVNWTTVDAKVRSSNNILMLIEQFQSIPNIPRTSVTGRNESNIRKRREMFAQMLQLYLSLPKSLITAITDSIKTYLMGTIANMPSDVQILLFQSAIETLIKYFEKEINHHTQSLEKGMPGASAKIVAMCELYSVNLNRYYPGIDMDLIKKDKKKKLSFVDFRDAIIHSSTYPKDKTKEDASKEAEIAEKIVRRLLFNVIKKHGKEIDGVKILKNENQA